MATAKHSTDLPADSKINPELRYRFVEHLLSRAKPEKRFGGGTVMVILIVLAAMVGIWFSGQEVLERLYNR